LQLNSETVVWNKEAEQPTSACSLPCEVGMIKKQQVFFILVKMTVQFSHELDSYREIPVAGYATAANHSNTYMTSLPVKTAVQDFGRMQTSFPVML